MQPETPPRPPAPHPRVGDIRLLFQGLRHPLFAVGLAVTLLIAIWLLYAEAPRAVPTPTRAVDAR